MPGMAFLLTPTRHDLFHALWFPALMGPFLWIYVRYRMLTWDVSAASRRDGVDYSPEAWRLSGYVAALFVLFAYPLMLSDYSEWLWKIHPQLTLAFIGFWISLCGWVCVRHFQLQWQADEKLRQDLETISREAVPVTPVFTPRWLRVWGWGNLVLLAALLVKIRTVLSSLP
jgi:hypothetical protein